MELLLVVVLVGFVGSASLFKWVLPKKIRMIEWKDRYGRPQWIRAFPNPGVKLRSFQWSRHYGKGRR